MDRRTGSRHLIDWFSDRYPDVPATTVRSQVSMLAGNSPAYLFHPTYSARDPILWRVGYGSYEPYDPELHGEIDAAPLETDAEEPSDPITTAQEFILEELIESNWERIDFGRPLKPWSPDGRPPRQFNAGPAGRIDFLCRDADTNALVVVELKRGTPTDAVIGQTLRYMGWVQGELAEPGQRVEGIIIVATADERLRLAVSVTPSLQIVEYRVDIRLNAVPA